MRYTPILFLLALTGCPNPGDKNGDSGGTETDTEDTDPSYETGCITVDGGGGYAHLGDAIALAQEGAVIELCDGTYEEAVTVDKGVTIRGATAGGVFLNGPGSDVPLTITGANVTVENLVLESPRTAVVIDGATNLAMNAITVAAAGSWGVTTNDSTVAFDGLTIVQPAAGGIQVAGGEVSIDNGDFQYPASFGIDVSDDAVVTVSNTTITGALMLSDDVSDGYAIQMDGGSLTMTDSAVAGADGIGIFAQDADITLTNTTISDVIYLGVFAFDSNYTFDGVAITGSYLQGAYLDGPEISLTNTTVSTVTGTSCSLTYDEWGQDGNPWCGGINIAGDTVNLTDVNVSGYENYGILVQPNDEDMATIAWDGGTIDDVGRWGAYLIYASGTVDGVTVSNMREPEIAEPCQGYIDQSAAFLGLYSELAMDGVTLKDNVGWGISALIGTATVTGSTFDGNGCTAFVNYQNVGTITGSTFTNGSDNGGVYDYQGVLTLDANTFVNNKAGAEYEYDYGSYIGRSVYSGGQGQDLVAYLSGGVYVTNNTFTSGDTSLSMQQVDEAIVTNNTWNDYEGSIAYFYQMPASNPALFADNVADDVVGPVVQSAYGPVEVSNVQVGTTRLSDLVTYEWYQDDVLQYSYSYQSGDSVFYASGYYYDDGAGSITDMPGSISIEDTSVSSAYGTLVYSYDAEVDVSGLQAGDVGGSAVSGNWNSYAPDVEVDGLTVGRTSSTAFSFYNYFSDYGAISLSDVSVDGSSGGGVYASAIGALELSDVSLGDLAGVGVQSSSRTYDYGYTYDAESGTYTYSYTDLDAATEITADNVTIASSSSSGFDLSGGSADLTNVTVSAAASDGVSAVGLTRFTASNVTISAPGGTGVDLVDSYDAYSYETSTYETIDGDTSATLSGVTVTDARYSGFAVEGGTVTMSACAGTGAAANGLDLVSTTADIQGNTFSTNTEYGMTCEDTTLAACATNVLTDNLLGAHLGCEDGCSE